MAISLPSRPDLDHLKRQAKALLKHLRDGQTSAAKTFIAHLPAAKTLTPANVRAAGFKLADAQSVVARHSGFSSWAALARHVDDLRALEGEWRFASLEIDGQTMPAAAAARSRILIDGDRFRTESPEATYEGVFTIDVERTPHEIDIDFVEGPEAGTRALGIFDLGGDHLTICLGLAGATRPSTFKTSRGSSHALERLTRASSARPPGVDGGTREAVDQIPQLDQVVINPKAFDGPMTPLLERLQGEWSAVELNQQGTPMNPEWLPYGLRTTRGQEMKVVFGGQTMSHAKMRFDDTVSPIAVDYLHLSGSAKGQVAFGIFEWAGDDARFAVAAAGLARPKDFEPRQAVTVSVWRKRPA